MTVYYYQGMSYEQASREALRLMQTHLTSENWFELPEQLIELRTIMQTHQGAFADLKARNNQHLWSLAAYRIRLLDYLKEFP